MSLTITIQSFNEEPTENEELLELRADLNQKIAFREMDYSELWDYFLEFLEYKNLAKRAIRGRSQPSQVGGAEYIFGEAENSI